MCCLGVSDRNLVFDLVVNEITDPQGYFDPKTFW